MSDLSHSGFLACRDCGVLQPAPAHGTPAGDQSIAEAQQAYAEFHAAHQPHDTVQLYRCSTGSLADRPLWDPMATITFAVTDGQRTYVVQAERPSIDEPRVYRFAPGALETTSLDVTVDDGDLRRGLDLAFYPHVLRGPKLDCFLSTLHEVVGHLNPDELPIAFDDADDPQVSIARMPDEAYQALLWRCAEIFDPWELPRVTEFLQANRNEDGLLVLRVRRQLTALSA